MLRSFPLVMILGMTLMVKCGVPPEELINKPSKSSPTASNNSDAVGETTPETQSLPACASTNCNCSDFQTQAEAQAVLEAFSDDRHGLDRNNNGIACESLPTDL